MLSPEEKRAKDERSVEELLNFIENGGGGAGAIPRGSKKKKGKPGRRLSPSGASSHPSEVGAMMSNPRPGTSISRQMILCP